MDFVKKVMIVNTTILTGVKANKLNIQKFDFFSITLKFLPKKKMTDLLDTYIEKRKVLKNDCNGHHNIGCVIYDKSRQYVLQFWI